MDSYALLDFGDGRKLERFGRFVLDRVSPAALGVNRSQKDWTHADLQLDDRGELMKGVRLPMIGWLRSLASISNSVSHRSGMLACFPSSLRIGVGSNRCMPHRTVRSPLDMP